MHRSTGAVHPLGRSAHSLPKLRKDPIMDSRITRRVRALRRQNPYAPTRIVDAYKQAIYELTPPRYPWVADALTWSQPWTGEVDGFEVEVVVEIDDQMQLGEDDVTGTFSDGETEDAIPNTFNGPNGYGCKWYIPANYRREYPNEHPKGMARGRVAEYRRWTIEQDMRDDAAREYYLISATATKHGVTGQFCLGGVDRLDDTGDAYIYEQVCEAIDEAIEEARRAIGRPDEGPDIEEWFVPRAGDEDEEYPEYVGNVLHEGCAYTPDQVEEFAGKLLELARQARQQANATTPQGATLVTIEGADLFQLREVLGVDDLGDMPGVTKVRVMVDGGLKIKVNEDMWSAPLGQTSTVEL